MMKFATLLLTTILAVPALADDATPPSAEPAATPAARAEVKKAKKQEKKAKRQALRKRAQAMRAETGPKSEGPHDNASAASENIEAGKNKTSEGAATTPTTN